MENLENLKPEDREKLENIVRDLVQEGFEIFLAGSVLERKDYDDIDVLAIDAHYSQLGSSRQKFEKAVSEIARKYGLELTESIDNQVTYVETTIIDRRKLEDKHTCIDITFAHYIDISKQFIPLKK